jgi:hypothetical protein
VKDVVDEPPRFSVITSEAARQKRISSPAVSPSSFHPVFFVREENFPDAPEGILSQEVTRALFGFTRKERLSPDEEFTLFELKLPFQKHVALLNECLKVCNVLGKLNRSRKISKKVAERAYNRIIADPTGACHGELLNMEDETKEFPAAIKEALQLYGYLDEWAEQVGFDATIPLKSGICSVPRKRKHQEEKTFNSSENKNCSTVESKIISCGESRKTSFWFISINQAFSDPFWDEWINAINEMRFCVGLGGKKNAYVCCSSPEENATFTTACGKYMYHALPSTRMEKKIFSLWPNLLCHFREHM